MSSGSERTAAMGAGLPGAARRGTGPRLPATEPGPVGQLPVDPDSEPGPSARAPHSWAHARLDVLAAIAAAGALGTMARFELGRLWPVVPGQFPTVTLAVNVSGSLLLGLLVVLLIERFPPTRYARAFLAIGLIGAYTTFSTFAVETVQLVRDHEPRTAATYVAVSVIGGLVAAWVGVLAARSVPHRHPEPPIRHRGDSP